MRSLGSRGWGALGLSVASSAAACALVSGLRDLQEMTGENPDAGSSDGGLETTRADDCTPGGPEICTDGIDNDCNGLVDCADPGCTAFHCVPRAPSGWALVALDPNGRAGCPPGYASATDLLVDPDLGPEGCACACDAGPATSCVNGSVGYKAFGNALCDVEGGIGTRFSDGKCDVASFGALNAYHLVKPVPASGSCSPTVTPTTPAAPAGRTCASSGPFGAGCSAGQACVPSPVSPYATCVSQPGATKCPPGFPMPHTAGTTLADTRACGPCSCALPSCTGATFTWYKDTACATSAASVPADGVCHPTPGGAVATAYEYTASIDCAVKSPPQPAGSATLHGALTVCCP